MTRRCRSRRASPRLHFHNVRRIIHSLSLPRLKPPLPSDHVQAIRVNLITPAVDRDAHPRRRLQEVADAAAHPLRTARQEDGNAGAERRVEVLNTARTDLLLL